MAVTDDTQLSGGPRVLVIGTMGWGALGVAHDCHIPARGSEVETTIERQKNATFLMFSLFLTGWEKPKVLRRIPDTGTREDSRAQHHPQNAQQRAL